MSYCVNCGVELDDSAKHCALCSTPVINPNRLTCDEQPVTPYSDKIVIPPDTRRRYAAFIASMVILIPNMVCLIINLVFSFDYLWATYLNASSLLFWVVCIFPFFLKKPRDYILVPLDALAAFLYTAVFYNTTHGDGWLLRLALPIILVVAVLVFSVIEWIKHKRLDWPLLVSAILIQLAVASFAIEFLIRGFYSFSQFPLVSIIIAACCVALDVFFLITLKNKRLRAWLSRKFFV